MDHVGAHASNQTVMTTSAYNCTRKTPTCLLEEFIAEGDDLLARGRLEALLHLQPGALWALPDGGTGRGL